MTLPYERTRAVNATGEFLLDLCDSKKTPRVPLAIRRQAMSLLRHYPTQFEMQVASDHEDERRRSIVDMQIFGRMP